MPLGWIDFSKDERNNVLNIMHLLNEPGAVDELGLGAVRDAFADYFFPGTSTVQTRAKYFLIVPYILLEAGKGNFGSDINSILRKIDSEERNCRDILIKNSNDGDGVIGSLVPKSWVLRPPSNIYWNGIKQLGIFKEDLSIKEYVGQSIIQRNLKQAKSYGNREKDAEENEKDDIDAGDVSSIQFWCLGDTYRNNWRENLGIELLPNEASFLRTQIITSQRDTLFSALLQKKVNLDKFETFETLFESIKDAVDPKLKHMMELANRLNSLVAIITTRYNLILSEGKNKEACDRWELFSTNLKYMAQVDLNEVFIQLRIINNQKLKNFLFQVQEKLLTDDINAVDELIRKREFYLKGGRAKTSHLGEYGADKWIGIRMFDYRFNSAKRIIKDIMIALGEQNV